MDSPQTFEASRKGRVDPDEKVKRQFLFLQEDKKFFQRFQRVFLPSGMRQQSVFSKGG